MVIYEEILRTFHKEKIKYVLVGGIAFNMLGGYRNTLDLDILVEMTGDNLKKIVKILKKKGYKIKQPVNPMMIADSKTRKNWISKKHMKAFNFYKEEELKEVDIIIESPVSFKQAIKNSVRVKGGDITIPVVSIDDLIKMKKNTGRFVDKLDVAELKKLKKMKEKA